MQQKTIDQEWQSIGEVGKFTQFQNQGESTIKIVIGKVKPTDDIAFTLSSKEMQAPIEGVLWIKSLGSEVNIVYTTE